MNTTILIGLFFCHYLADYTHLSTAWMLNAKRFGKPLFPIFIHALTHATLMFIAIWIFNSIKLNYWNGILSKEIYLFLFQLITHFLIDVWKGRMNGWLPSLQNPANKWHWVVFGFDQFLHALIIILMVSYL